MPTAYELMSDQELAEEIARLEAEAEHLRSLGLKLDMARGKPSPEQTALSRPMLDVLDSSTEMDEKNAYTTHMGIEPPYVIEIPKYNKFLVRAVHKF